ncbi:MAG: hypothetical protein KDC92_07800 [Bacteroidetes bacterium]|nr:hypothetical protein [Bacteroidota bacterium]
MKNLTKLFALLFVAFFILESCSGDDDENPCGDVQTTSYYDRTNIRFQAGDGTDSLYQNFDRENYPSGTSGMPFFAKSVNFKTSSLVELNFVRAEFDSICNPYYEHVFQIVFNIDQYPHETKTYDIGYPGTAPNYAYYTQGSLMPPGGILLTSANDAGSITITKYVPGEALVGYFQVIIGNDLFGGRFNYNLK